MAEIAFRKTASLSQLKFIPEWGEINRMGTVAGVAPNLHLTADSYGKAPSSSLSCHM